MRAKSKDKKQDILKRLMLFGLKPSLRVAALKMLVCKQKQVSLSDDEVEDEEGKHLFVHLKILIIIKKRSIRCNNQIFKTMIILLTLCLFGNTHPISRICKLTIHRLFDLKFGHMV